MLTDAAASSAAGWRKVTATLSTLRPMPGTASTASWVRSCMASVRVPSRPVAPCSAGFPGPAFATTA